jgi:hypothetical protein
MFRAFKSLKANTFPNYLALGRHEKSMKTSESSRPRWHNRQNIPAAL